MLISLKLKVLALIILFLPGQKGELKLNVFDLLKQNRSIVRNFTDTHIEDIQNQVLQQYFMLSFTYNLRNFGTAASRAAIMRANAGVSNRVNKFKNG